MANLHLIKSIAKEKKITLKSLSEQVGISEQGMQKILKENTTSIVTLEKIAKILSVHPAVFFDNYTVEQSQGENDPSADDTKPHATANGNGAIAIAGSGNVTVPQIILEMLAEKDRQLAAKDEIIKQYIMRK